MGRFRLNAAGAPSERASVIQRVRASQFDFSHAAIASFHGADLERLQSVFDRLKRNIPIRRTATGDRHDLAYDAFSSVDDFECTMHWPDPFRPKFPTGSGQCMMQ